MRPCYQRFLFAIPILLASADTAAAHNLIVQVDVQPQVVRVEAGFDDDSPAGQAPVKVHDEAGALTAEGRTDDKGVWACSRPKPGTYRVRVEFIGHDKDVSFTIPDDSFRGQFASWQPNKVVGVVIGLGLLAGIILFFQIRRHRENAHDS